MLKNISFEYIFFGIVLIGVPIYVTIIPYVNYRSAEKSWLPTVATVTKFERVSSPEDKDIYNNITYQYCVDGKNYLSSRFSFGVTGFRLDERIYAIGNTVVCYYNPQIPSHAVLSMSIEPHGIVMLIIDISFAIAGLLCLTGAYVRIGNNKDKCIDSPVSKYAKDVLLTTKSGHMRDDPIAQKTSSEPLHPNDGNISTYQRLFAVSSCRVEFRPKLAMVLTLIFLVLLFLAVAVWVVFQFKLQDYGVVVLVLLLLSTSLIILLIKICRLYHCIPTFDLNQNYFWQGSKNSDLIDFSKYAIALNNIYAIQLVHKKVSLNNEMMPSCEINLVLNDGNRIFVLNGGDQNAVREDAQALALFLRIPLWVP